jgi:hypothetical protein
MFYVVLNGEANQNLAKDIVKVPKVLPQSKPHFSPPCEQLHAYLVLHGATVGRTFPKSKFLQISFPMFLIFIVLCFVRYSVVMSHV